MRSFLLPIWTGLVRIVSSALSRPVKSRSHPRTCGPEPLEERVALSAVLPVDATPSACTCPFCMGAAYRLAGSPGLNSANGKFKWSQPNGKGSPVTITYSYSNLLDGKLGGGLSTTAIRAAIEEALSRWAAVAPLRFVEVADSGPGVSGNEYDPSGKPMLRFGRRSIDGKGNVLAYGYFPTNGSGLAGDVHFDTAERWSVHPSAGFDLLEIATHEIGHALGLDHQPIPANGGKTAIMNPHYAGRYRGLGSSFLYADDVAGIRALYGSGVGSVTPLRKSAPTGPFVVTGNTLHVTGTTGDDVFIFDGESGTVTLNDQLFTGDLSLIRSIIFDGKGGTDQALLTGTVAAERFDLRPGWARMTGPIWNVTVSNVESIEATGGVGDWLVMRDSAGNDRFYGRPGDVQLIAGAFNLQGREFAGVSVVASRGYDRAWLYDSAGDDIFWGKPYQSQMSGPGYLNRVTYFDAVFATASQGNDQAKLFGSRVIDVLVTTPIFARLSSNALAYTLEATNFPHVAAYGRGGQDAAHLYDSVGDDTLTGRLGWSRMSGDGYIRIAYSFTRVSAYASSGYDRAEVYDSSKNDTFVGKRSVGKMFYPGRWVQFVGFDEATVYGLAGGWNRRTLSALAYEIAWVGVWRK